MKPYFAVPLLAVLFRRRGCLHDVRLRNRLVFDDDDGRGLGLDDHLRRRIVRDYDDLGTHGLGAAEHDSEGEDREQDESEHWATSRFFTRRPSKTFKRGEFSAKT
jgi:hypothetical protein